MRCIILCTPISMRLTVDIIEQSISFVNAIKERELDLRGK